MLAYSMTPLQQLSQMRYLVVGLGKSGFSVAQFLHQQGFSFAVQDDRELPPFKTNLLALGADCEILHQALSSELMNAFDCVVVSPGVSIQTEQFATLDKSKTKVIGDIELFALFNSKPVIAITGSNGKTTVTSLMGEAIEACGKSVAVGGNIGIAALQLIDSNAEMVVLELSSFQLETTCSLSPVASVILNVSEDHMDRYADFEAYIQAKQRVHQNTQCVVFNRDDALSKYEAENSVSFGLSKPVSETEFGLIKHHNNTYLAHGEQALIDVQELKLQGYHNWSNCLAVLALSYAAGLPLAHVVKALKDFSGISHRYEMVAEQNNIVWINDSKATNPGATLAAIQSTERPVVLIAGGQSKQADARVLNSTLKNKVKTIILMGEDAALLAKQWQGCCTIEHVDNMQQAIELAQLIAQSGDCVLLSPACASFDQYSGYEARGDDFKQRVLEVLAR